MIWQPLDGFETQPIAIVGAGTLGRQLAALFSRHGWDVRLHDRDAGAMASALRDIARWAAEIESPARPRTVTATSDLASAVSSAWLVIEAIPERIELKRALFGELDRLAGPSAILATNSSSLPSSWMIDDVTRPERVLNTHFYNLPWVSPAVELMSCGATDPAVINLLVDRFGAIGLRPFVARAESLGFIYNRIWAAIKREALLVAAEGVATPAEIDELYRLVSGARTGPFERMDLVGLDVVLDIEEQYAASRPGVPDEARAFLRQFIDGGALGRKSGRGFYGYPGDETDER